MEDISQYLAKNPKRVLTYFKILLEKKCLVKATFGKNQSFLTAIIDINENDKTLILDCGPKEYLNNELLNLGIVNCQSSHEGINVKFEGRGIEKAGTSDQMALSMKIPDSIYWIQRRKSHRVRSPLSKKSYCRISLSDPESDNHEDFDFQLYDLSATGFSILDENKEHNNELIPKNEFYNCQLVLEDDQAYSISFIVQTKMPFNPNHPKKTQRIGCEFIDLPASIEAAFLRYTQMIEREIKKNLGS